jgi:hypothetical protein
LKLFWSDFDPFDTLRVTSQPDKSKRTHNEELQLQRATLDHYFFAS